VQVTVDSRGETAASAGADNRIRQERVIDAAGNSCRRLGNALRL